MKIHLTILISLLFLSACGTIGYKVNQTDGNKTGHEMYWVVYEKNLNTIWHKESQLDRIEGLLNEILEKQK